MAPKSRAPGTSYLPCSRADDAANALRRPDMCHARSVVCEAVLVAFLVAVATASWADDTDRQITGYRKSAKLYNCDTHEAVKDPLPEVGHKATTSSDGWLRVKI